MTCKQTQQKAPPEAVIRRIQNNMMLFTVSGVQHPPIIMRDYKHLKKSLRTRIKIWLLNLFK
jgi:hypothetical protein